MLLYTSIVQRLHSQHESIEKIIHGIDIEKLEAHPLPGKWSIKDQVAHLAKYQPVFIDRIHKIAKGDTPSFPRYSAEEDPEFPVWQTWDIDTLMERLYADRKLINDLIGNTSCSQGEMSGIHPKFGTLTLVQWTEFFLLHEAHHIFSIFQLSRM